MNTSRNSATVTSLCNNELLDERVISREEYDRIADSITVKP